MADHPLATLESKLDQLLAECQRLRRENAALHKQAAGFKEKEEGWLQERSRLIEKNDLARTRVEAMITRLKSLEEQA
ncbi:MAG: TIGR02449 family protein [Gammaproteobacteria bacterium]|uniref:TIGR02449 family protein n=1 Tax=Pseudomaricurvus alcaniphilus TaxID=1166482 RepID=UPI0014085506|nr:TIGR02449 family protein [Pseudomaricurvus alcaniphilus]MBR9912236.1 TIGR02449 family protein [Gammaproteobacteria bacterium]NHN38700.1 TIGR02449 family protein [Pseudomaricurvus alcaniphilus]